MTAQRTALPWTGVRSLAVAWFLSGCDGDHGHVSSPTVTERCATDDDCTDGRICITESSHLDMSNTCRVPCEESRDECVGASTCSICNTTDVDRGYCEPVGCS